MWEIIHAYSEKDLEDKQASVSVIYDKVLCNKTSPKHTTAGPHFCVLLWHLPFRMQGKLQSTFSPSSRAVWSISSHGHGMAMRPANCPSTSPASVSITSAPTPLAEAEPWGQSQVEGREVPVACSGRHRKPWGGSAGARMHSPQHRKFERDRRRVAGMCVRRVLQIFLGLFSAPVSRTCGATAVLLRVACELHKETSLRDRRRGKDQWQE